MLFGRNPLSSIILATLDLKEEDFSRFRDVFISEGKIAVYTRIGGGNRQEYQDTIDKIREHPNYVSDMDDDFDSTYATFYFSFPEKHKELLSKLEMGNITSDERWAAKIKELAELKPEEVETKYPSVVALLEEISKAFKEVK